MKNSTLKNWKLSSAFGSSRLTGEVYNDNRFKDGTIVRTSILKNINFETMIAETHNTVYVLG